MFSTCRSSSHYLHEDLSLIKDRALPRHIAIIMDGNRRWMQRQLISKRYEKCLMGGHWAGAAAVTTVVEAAVELGIQTLTVYGFSTENWGRTEEEVDTLLHIFNTYLKENGQKMMEMNVRLHIIGDLTPFSSTLKQTIQETCDLTQSSTGLNFVVALNYGGRDELRRAIQHIISDVEAGHLCKDAITESCIARYLDTVRFGDPDLLIRTSGEKRISNFLLWQIAYAEVYITDTLWPDFTPRDLLMAVVDFQKRQRRVGR